MSCTPSSSRPTGSPVGASLHPSCARHPKKSPFVATGITVRGFVYDAGNQGREPARKPAPSALDRASSRRLFHVSCRKAPCRVRLKASGSRDVCGRSYRGVYVCVHRHARVESESGTGVQSCCGACNRPAAGQPGRGGRGQRQRRVYCEVGIGGCPRRESGRCRGRETGTRVQRRRRGQCRLKSETGVQGGIRPECDVRTSTSRD